MPPPMAKSSEKANNFSGSIKKLLKFCKPQLPLIIIALLLSVAATVLAIIGPSKLGDLTNAIKNGLMGEIDMALVWNIGTFLIVIYCASVVFNYAQGFIMASATQYITRRLRTNISRKINVLPLKYFDSVPTGDILSRVTNDVDTIGQSLNQSIVSLVSSIVMFFGVMIMMFVTNWILALSAIAAAIIGFSIMILIVSRSQKYFVRQQISLGKVNGHIEETYSGHTVMKVFNGEDKARATFKSFNGELYDSAWKSQFLSGLMMPLMSFIGNLGFVVVCVVGSVLAASGQIEMGTIVSFMLYIRLFTQPLSQLAQSMTSLQSTAAASERVFGFLEEKEMEDESGKTAYLDPQSVRGDVEFSHVSFGYDESRTIIKDFSASVKSGQKVAIVGPTGAGKTTLVNLLMRFYECNGDIKIDGVPIKDLTRENVYDIFGMVLQDTWLFEGTVRENVVYGKKGVSDEDLERACQAANIDNFIKTLPKGYDTVLDETTSLSSGQKQLMTIARAMIENAPMLILDEATSSVDTRTEALIQNAMDALTQGRTSFVIAHRLSTIKNADIILVMKDGDIIEKGSHDELIKQRGYYCELYNSQFSKSMSA